MYTIFKLSEKIISTTKELKKLASERLRNVQFFGNNRIRFKEFPQIFFAEKDSKNLGCYDRTQNIIELNTILLDSGMVKNLENVFLHELAHYCDSCINSSSAHDETFRSICDALGVDKAFSGAKAQQYIGERDSIKKKIEKLMALSSSDFDGEASSALKKAYDLAAKYCVSIDKTSDEEGIFGVCCASGKRMEHWLVCLSNAVSSLSGAYFLRDYTVSEGVAYMFYGTKDQVELCMYMFDALMQNVESRVRTIVSDIKEARCGGGYCADLFELARKEELLEKYKNVSRIDKNQIRLGIVMGFRSQIKGETSKSIELSRQTNKEKYKRISGCKLTTSKSRSISITGQFQAGYNSGKQMSIPSTGAGMTKRLCAV